MATDLLGLYTAPPAQHWYPVEIRIEGERAHVVEVLATNKHDAFLMAIKSLSKFDLDRACSGIHLSILKH